MLIRAATPGDLPDVLTLLENAGLPVAGVESAFSTFSVAEADGLLGVAGLEVHGHVGLLRSVTVRPEERQRGQAGRLVQHVLGTARALGLTDLYLLTTTAEGYFPRFGFAPVLRDQAPAALAASAEFQGACPQTAILMHLPLKETLMTLTAAPTHTQAFLDALAPHADKALVFALHGEVLVRAGYHVTEVKAVTIEAMDCGGRPAAWRETVVQLWNPGGAEHEGFMTAGKFLGIYRTVAASVPVRGEAELRFEYGDQEHPTIQYRVGGLEVQADRVLVQLGYPAVSCKPRDEREAATESACCRPSAAPAVGVDELPVATTGRCCG